jgi:MFS family permease
LNNYGSKITYALLAIQSLFSAAMIMGFTIASIIVVDLADNLQWTGVPATVMMIGAAIVAYPSGRLMDKIGRRWGLSIGYILGMIGMTIAGFAVIYQSLPFFLLGTLGLGFARGIATLGRYAAADANPPNRRGWAVSMVVLGGTVGSVGGPAVIGWTTDLAEQFGLPGLSGAWFFGAICFALCLIIVHIFLHPDPLTVARQFDNHDSELFNKTERSFREIMLDPLPRLAVGAMIFGQLSMVLVMVVTPVHMHSHTYEISSISFVIMAHTFGMFGLSFMTGRLIDKITAPIVIGLGCLILGVACLMAPLVEDVYWLAMALFLLGLGWNFCFVAGSTLLSNILQPNEKGRIQGLVDSLVNLASATGSIGGGLIFAAMGFWMMSWLTIIATIPPVIQIMILKNSEQKTAPTT